MQNLAASEPPGSMGWGLDGTRSPDDPQYKCVGASPAHPA